MKLYSIKSSKTGKEELFLKKTVLATKYGINIDRLEVAIMKDKPIKKRDGEELHIEYREADANVKLNDITL